MIGGLLLLALIGFAATRSSVEPAPANVTPAQGAPTPAPAAQVIVQRTEVTLAPPGPGLICTQGVTMTVSIQVSGAKVGDTVHLLLTGPGLPSEVTGQLDAIGAYTTPGWPVKGSGTWTGRVDNVAGRPVTAPTTASHSSCN